MQSSIWSRKRDTRDGWRYRPAAPFRYRLRPPAALPHARRAAQQSQALQKERCRHERSSSAATCEAAGEVNALSDSGPWRPAFAEEVWACEVRVQAYPAPSATAGGHIYTPLWPAHRLGRLTLLPT